MPGIQIRPVGPNDLDFLREMLVEAAFWRPETPAPDVTTALTRPDLSYLLSDWGRPGDAGSIAEADDASIGAAWYRLWTEAQHSYGFVDPATPELGIGVVALHRGCGVGTALLQTLLQTARDAQICRVSLSVEIDNPALRLYERVGFKRLERVEGAWTMVAET